MLIITKFSRGIRHPKSDDRTTMKHYCTGIWGWWKIWKKTNLVDMENTKILVYSCCLLQVIDQVMDIFLSTRRYLVVVEVVVAVVSNSFIIIFYLFIEL